MKILLTSFGKIVLPIFFLLSLGAPPLFANVTDDLHQEDPVEGDRVQPGHYKLWAAIENPGKEITDPFEHIFPGLPGKGNASSEMAGNRHGISHSARHLRDFRSFLGQLLYPTHFFW